VLGAMKRPAHALGLDLIHRCAQPGGVGEGDRIAGDVHPHLDDVAGGAGDARDDGRLALR
jgi:hypothetical protein